MSVGYALALMAGDTPDAKEIFGLQRADAYLRESFGPRGGEEESMEKRNENWVAGAIGSGWCPSLLPRAGYQFCPPSSIIQAAVESMLVSSPPEIEPEKTQNNKKTEEKDSSHSKPSLVSKVGMKRPATEEMGEKAKVMKQNLPEEGKAKKEENTPANKFLRGNRSVLSQLPSVKVAEKLPNHNVVGAVRKPVSRMPSYSSRINTMTNITIRGLRRNFSFNEHRRLSVQKGRRVPSKVNFSCNIKARLKKTERFGLGSFEIREAVERLMAIIKILGLATLHLWQYQGDKAVKMLEQLPDSHWESAWVKTMLGKAYYESNNMKKAHLMG